MSYELFKVFFPFFVVFIGFLYSITFHAIDEVFILQMGNFCSKYVTNQHIHHVHVLILFT